MQGYQIVLRSYYFDQNKLSFNFYYLEIYKLLLLFSYSHRYGMEHISCTGITNVIQRVTDLRQKVDGKDTRFCVVVNCLLSTFFCFNIGILQNVRGSSQVRFHYFYSFLRFYAIIKYSIRRNNTN